MFGVSKASCDKTNADRGNDSTLIFGIYFIKNYFFFLIILFLIIKKRQEQIVKVILKKLFLNMHCGNNYFN